jgi:peptidyl-prolyl cis-trans isomerase D
LTNTKNAVKALKDDDPQKEQWNKFIIDLIESKKAEKYMAIVTNGLYVNALDAKDSYEGKNKLANFKYAVLPYTSLPDNKVTQLMLIIAPIMKSIKASLKTQQELRIN